jgi:hypothetical protein
MFSFRYEMPNEIKFTLILVSVAEPWLRQLLDASLPPQWPGIDSRSVNMRFGRKKWHWDRILSGYFAFSCQYHATNAPYLISPTCCCCQKQIRAKHSNLPKSKALFEMGIIPKKITFKFLVFIDYK